MKVSLLTALAALSSPWGIVSATEDVSRTRQKQVRGQTQTSSKRLRRGLKKKESDGSGPNLESLNCVLVEAIKLYVPGQEPEDEREQEEWRCKFREEYDTIKTIEGLPGDFFSKNWDAIESGETQLKVEYPSYLSDVVNTPEVLSIPEEANVELENKRDQIEEDDRVRRRRATVAKEGVHSILIIRVTDSTGMAPVRTASDLRDDVFGIGTDPHNLRSQYTACSGGKLDFVPGTGTSIDNGVFELQIPEDVSGQHSVTVENWVTQYANATLGDLLQWDLVMYILPSTVSFSGGAAYTYVGYHHSVYKDEFSSNLLVLMHEVGHNLGQRHSGKGSLLYDDGTCMMGAHVYADDAPRMCFNGAKSWYFGWYQDRHITVDPTEGSGEQQLVGVDDYLNGQSNVHQAVVLRINSHTSNDLYVMYNRKEGVNDQVHEMGDLVTVVEQGQDGDQSWLLAGISELTAPYRYPSWNGGSVDLVIEVCERVYGTPDFARILVYLDDDANRRYCAHHIPGSEKAELSIRSGDGDYREKNNGSMRSGSTVHNLFGSNWNLHGLRFEATGPVLIPPGSQIVSAKITVYPFNDSQYLGNEMRGYAVGHAIGDPPQYSANWRSISNAPKTSAIMMIDPNLPPWVSGYFQELVEVTPIVEEIVHRSDYREGNPIEIFLVGTGGGNVRKFRTTESGASSKLTVVFLPPTGSDTGDSGPPQAQEQEAIVEVTDAKDDYKEAANGSIGIGSKTHNMFSSSHERHAYRFQNVPVPQGATILEARLELIGKSAWSLKRDMSGIIQGENEGDSPPFQHGQYQLRDAPKTSALIRIENPPAWEAEKYNSVGDIAPIIQELVDRGDYSSGNAIKLILSNNGTSSGRRVRTFDNGAPPRLIIRYKI